MALNPGTQLGPYEITAALGAGGMGEVYRARDKRLERTVAVKVLPTEVSANAERRQRFEREARTISSLNHPNICALYDVGSQDGIEYLVLEYVEGETLEKRLEKGPLPTDILLRHGMEIADALEKAHRSGVIHRDLKPANIMLTKSGAKLLDFGLAKWSAAGTSEQEILKTLTAGATKLTEQGTILGTFQYMAPEQLEGKEADARTDLFAFGEVLYEMATGRPAFAGKTKASLIAAILSAEPAPISTVQPMTPPALERLVRGCLEKDPDERWQTAHDVKLQLRTIAEGGSQIAVPAPVVALRKRRERLLAAATIAGGLAAILFAALYWSRTPETARIVRSYIKAMPNSSFVLTAQQGGFAVSPDGLRLAYVAQNADGKALLWVRALDSLEAQALAGTEEASFPFWSQDSQYIGFFASGKLKKIESSGGPPLTLCDAPNPRGGTWNQYGEILFAPSLNVPLHRVSASGGNPIPVTTLDHPEKGVTTHRWPQFLPDGRHFLYVAGTPLTPRENPTNAIMVGSLDSTESKLLLHSHASAQYALGHILFLRQSTLMAQSFDAKRLELRGEASPIADPVSESELTLYSMFSASENGLLAYMEGTNSASRELLWLDRSGKKVGGVPGADTYMSPRISPDGKRVLYTLVAPWYEVWSYDMSLGVKTRLTFGTGSGRAHLSAVWSPDGQSIAYVSIRAGKWGVYEKAADGSGNEEVLMEDTQSIKYMNDWSPDGKYLAFQHALQGMNEIWMLPLAGERKPIPFLQSQFPAILSSFSPNGKWLAYCSTESGEQKVYVVPFPGPGGKWQVSPGGGCYARWRRDGKELFYLSPDNRIMAAEIKTEGSSFTIGAVKPLFETRVYRSTFGGYDVAADGQRFMICYEPGQPNVAITLVENWDAELKKK
jgi:eukaryotic-like serine/threonine-protein kinase